MLTDLKESSLACKCVFCRPEQNAKGDPMELNFEDLELQKWNIPMDRAQRVDEKNVIICHLTPMVMKMLKITHFFCWWHQKTSCILGKIFKRIWKILFSFFRKGYGLFGLWATLIKISTFENTGFRYFSVYSAEPITHFLKEFNEIFQVQLNILFKLWLTFCCH